MKRNYYLLILFTSFCFSQSKEQRLEIIKNSDIETLSLLSKRFSIEGLERKERIEKYLVANPDKTKVTNIDGVKSEIYDILPNGEVEYFRTSNVGASITARANKLYSGGGLGLNIQGQGMTVHVWDGGSALTSHNEFPNNKVVSYDGAELNNHATHVMGTILAQGTNATLRGLAFDASGISYDWNDDFVEMTEAAAEGMLVSNHSYGSTVSTRWYFGAYDTRARNFDIIANAAPYYLAVAAAGNDRDDYTDPSIGAYIAEKGGYNLIKSFQNSKNVLTVGAVGAVLNYTGADSVEMSSFSNWGPTDDGRIKPEIVTKGIGVKSPISTSNTASATYQGTSMASPGIAGVAILLQQYYSSLFPTFMRAASLKGLIMHSADEAGYYDGPDYENGWGLVNTERAASIITGKKDNNAILSELTVINGQSYTTTISATGSQPLMVSISWTDPAALANNTNQNDPSTLYLKNDLDLRITKDGQTYFPWTLDPILPDAPAVNDTDNFRDNFEKVQIDNPNGVYTITVTHKGSLVNGNQSFTLIASANMGIALGNSDFVLNDATIFLYPNPANDVLNYSFSKDVSLKSVVVSDVSGKRIFSNNSDLTVNQIDISDLSSGIYFVTFSAEQGSFTKKFVKN